MLTPFAQLFANQRARSGSCHTLPFVLTGVQRGSLAFLRIYSLNPRKTDSRIGPSVVPFQIIYTQLAGTSANTSRSTSP